MGLIKAARAAIADRIEDAAFERNQAAKALHDSAPAGDAGAGQRIVAMREQAASLERRDLADRIRGT